jgi:hypothetical protein
MLIPSLGCCVVTGFRKSILFVDIPFALHKSTISQLECAFCHLKQKRERNRCEKIKSCLSKNDCFIQMKKGVEGKVVQGWFYSRALTLFLKKKSSSFH